MRHEQVGLLIVASKTDSSDLPEVLISTGRRLPGKSSFYRLAGKRMFDVVTSALGLSILSPLLLMVILIVKLSSPGPAFYRQERVGKDGRIFSIVKIRTMIVSANQEDAGITVAGDPRITRVGLLLRRWKLDEFPQLWNVLKGEMSLVGPRPELPRYVGGYTDVQRRVLNVRPGITDTASLAYRHEEIVLSSSSDPERLYRQVVLPHKLSLNAEYLSGISFGNDLSLIVRTLRSLF